MIVAKFSGSRTAKAHGLTQWDYGQELAIECAGTPIPDGTEIHFYQGNLSSIAYIKNNHVLVPDLMLQVAKVVTAYVYVREENSGETILSILMPINARPQPDDYILPEYKEYKRLLPPGGDPGQALTKATEKDFEVAWITQEANLEPMTDDDIDNICI